MTLNRMKTALVASAALLAFALPATAAAPVPSQETLCLAAFLTMAGDTDPEIKNAGLMGALYYAGRVQGANPGKDPIDLVIPVFDLPNAGALIDAAAVRCGEEMQVMGRRWIERGEEMQRASKGISGT